MTMLNDIVSERRVFLDLAPAPKAELLGEITRRLADLGEIADPESIHRLLVEREEFDSTAVKPGFAFPHVFTPQLAELQLTIGRVREGADFASLDGSPVEFILLALGPPSQQRLRVLARLARVAGEPGMLEALREAASPAEVAGIFLDADRRVAAVG